MPLKYPHAWKFGEFPYEVSNEAHRRFIALIDMMAEGVENQQPIFEDFKTAFGNSNYSSNSSWSRSDMESTMDSLRENAARYVAAFYSGMESVQKEGVGVPSLKVVNKILSECEIPLLIQPPDLLLKEEYGDVEDEEDEPIPAHPPRKASAAKAKQALSNKVFVVHGHDNEAKQEVARLLGRLDLEPIILHEQPNKGRTIIEKFMDAASDVTFAVIILTPDDLGAAKVQPKPLQSRARQNVVFEMGFFYAALGRERVCALLKGDTQQPSDVAGVVYLPMDEGGSWKTDLAKEIKAAGLQINLNSL